MGTEYKNASWNICTQTLMHTQMNTYTQEHMYAVSPSMEGRSLGLCIHSLKASLLLGLNLI